MKKYIAYFASLTLLLAAAVMPCGTIYAQGMETFESETTGAISFSENSEGFAITNDSEESNYDIELLNAGSDDSAPANISFDNSSGSPTQNDGSSDTITTTDGGNESRETILDLTCSIIQDSPVSILGGNDGQATVTPTGGTGPYTYAWDSKALNFDDVDNLVDCGNSFSLTSYTKEAWIKYNGPNDQNNIISGRTSNSHAFWAPSGKIKAGHNKETFYATIQDATPLPINQWVHYALTYDGSNGTWYLYRNGVAINIVVDASTAGFVLTDVYLGSFNNTTTGALNLFKGQLDDLRIWSTVRTPAQIEANFNQCLTGLETGLVALYKFEDETAVNSASTSGLHDGTLVGVNPSTDWVSGLICGENTFQTANNLTAGPHTVTVLDANDSSTTCEITIDQPSVTASLTIAEEVDITTIAAPGTLTYTITVDNTGSNSLTSVLLTDVLATTGPTLTGGDTNSNSIMETSEMWVYTASYEVMQADIIAGLDIVNTSSVVTTELPIPQEANAITTIFNCTLPTTVVNGPLVIDCANLMAVLDGAGSATTDVTYTWVATEGGTITGATNGITATGTTAGTYTLTVIETATGCESSAAVIVTLDNNAPVSGGDLVACDSGQALTAMATAGAGEVVDWYAGPSGGTTITPTQTGVGMVTYYAEARNTTTNCVSSTRTPIILTINALPDAPTGQASQSACDDGSGGPVTGDYNFTYNAGNLWSGSYSTTPGVIPGHNYFSLELSADFSEKASADGNGAGCSGIFTGSGEPNFNASNGNAYLPDGQSLTLTNDSASNVLIDYFDSSGFIGDFVCSGIGTADITLLPGESVTLLRTGGSVAPVTGGSTAIAAATPPVGSSVVWYDAATGGNTVLPAQEGVGTSMFWASSVDDVTGCESTTRFKVTLTINLDPTVTATASYMEVCAGDSVILTGGGANTYTWDNGVDDGVAFVPAATTTYTVTGTDTNGCINTATVEVIVNPLPTIAIATAATCSADLLSYSVSVNISSGALTSSVGGTVTDNTGGNWTISGILADTDTILTVTNGNDCDQILTVTAPNCMCPVVDAPVTGGDLVVCDSGQTLTTMAAAGTGEVVEWYAGPAGGAIITPELTGEGTVTYYAEARNTTTNCTSETRTPVSLTINAVPTVTFTAPEDLCFDAGVQTGLSGGLPTGGTYSGPGVTDDGNGITYSFEPATAGIGTHPITYTFTNGNNCTDAMSDNVEVFDLPVISTVATDVLCHGGNLGAIDLTVSGGSGTYTFLWSNNATTEDIMGLEAGVYSVTVIDSNGCGKSISTTINQPDAAISATDTSMDVANYGGTTGSIDMTISGGTAPYTFAWNGPNTFTASSEDLIDLSAGIYDLVITDVNECIFNYSVTINQPDAFVSINIKVLLGGPYNNNTGLMNDGLRSNGFIPISTPYSDPVIVDLNVLNSGGLSGTGLVEDDIVDWVFVEIRSSANSSNILGSRSALLQRDGDVVGLDGLSDVVLPVVPKNYYLSIKHRNHLGIMTASSVTLSETPTTVDFTDANNQITNGTNAQAIFGLPINIVVMWPGDVNGNGQIKYLGPNNDANGIKDYILNPAHGNPSGSNFYSSTGYDNADINMNGQIRYLGPGNDTNTLKDIILSHTVNTTFSNFFSIVAQIPN